MQPVDGRDMGWFGQAGASLEFRGKQQATLRVQAGGLAMSEGVQWNLGACGDRRPAACTGYMGAYVWFPCRQSCGEVIIARRRLYGPRRTMFWAPLDVYARAHTHTRH